MITQGLLLAGGLYWSLGLFWAIYGLMRYKHDPAWRVAISDQIPVVVLFGMLVLIWPLIMMGWIEENNDDGPWRG